MRIARRNVVLSFLGLAAAHVLGRKSALALGLPDQVSAQRPGQPSRQAPVDRLARQLVALVLHPESARRIGEVYLAATPQEADTSRLVALLCPDPRGGGLKEDVLNGRPQMPPRPELWRQIAARRDGDFCEGRIVRLNGWIVPHTEARLCALVALHSPPRGFA